MGTILKIEEEQGKYAKNIASKLNASINRKKGMIDMLGVTLFAKFMKKQHIDLNMKNCLHKFPFALEDYSITDVSYNGYKIFVITVFNENYIRIPKLHFELEIQPDFYVITEVNKNIEKGAIGGFVVSKNISSMVCDDKFYYPSKKDILKIEGLIGAIKNPRPLRKTFGRHLETSAMFVKLSDDELSKNEKDKLVKHLMTCESCTIKLRDFIQFDSAMNPAKYFINALEANNNLPKEAQKKSQQVAGLDKNDKKISKSATPITNVAKSVSNITREEEQAIENESTTTVESKGMFAFAQNFDDESTVAFLKKKIMSKKEAIDLMFKNKGKAIFDINFSKINIKDLQKKKKILISLGVAGLLFIFAIGAIVIKKSSKELKPIEGIEAVNYDDPGSFYDDKYSQEYFEEQNGIALDYTISAGSSGKSSVSGVKNISWEVDSDVAGKESYTKFLQIVGKNIKLSLQNELLLTSDFPRNHTVKAEIKFAGSGNVGSLKLIQGSGSPQIDDMIQKCVYETLSYIKPPKTGFLEKNLEMTLVIEL